MARQRGIVVPISATDNTERAFAQVNERIAALQERLRVAQSTGAATGRAVGDGFHQSTEGIYAASSAIREFEGQLPIRAVERFFTNVLKLGPILVAAFPVVGAIAFAGQLEECISKVIQLYQAGVRAPVEIERAFNELNGKLETTNDELSLSNAKLQEQIDKIEGRPNNGAAEALEQIKVSADHALTSIQADITALNELLDKQTVGNFESFLSSQAPTKSIDKDIKSDDLSLVDKAEDARHGFNVAVDAAGGDKGKVAAAQKQYYATLDKNFGDFIEKYKGRIDDLKAQQAARNDYIQGLAAQGLSSFGVSTDNSAQINSVNGAIRTANALLDHLKSEAQNSDLTTRLNADKRTKGGDGGAEKLRRLQQEMAAAQQAVAESQRKADEQAATDRANDAKRNSDEELAALDDKHKRQLVSDKDYYAQKLAIQVQALDAEDAANSAKQGSLSGQIRGLVVDKGRSSNTDTGRVRDNAKIIDLQTQVNALEQQRLAIVQKRADLVAKAGTDDFEATKKAVDEELQLAAQLETLRGGSATARVAADHKKFNDDRRAAGPAGAATVDSLEGIADAKLGTTGAQQGFSDATGGINAGRQRISYEQSAGLISQQDAQRQKIDLDKQEAAAMQPLLAAYQQLASLGVAGASAKVGELQEKMYELQNPVNEIAASVRTQLDGAFEQLFMNIGKGQKTIDDFGKAIEKAVLSEGFKQVINPGIQTALGALIPNGAGHRAPTASPVASALGGLIPGLGKIIPGVSVGSGGAGDITVQIINQGSPLESGGVTQQMSGAGQEDVFAQRVLSVILKDAETNGPGLQSILGAVSNG